MRCKTEIRTGSSGIDGSVLHELEARRMGESSRYAAIYIRQQLSRNKNSTEGLS